MVQKHFYGAVIQSCCFPIFPSLTLGFSPLSPKVLVIEEAFKNYL